LLTAIELTSGGSSTVRYGAERNGMVQYGMVW
jgi:hypothetical protein